MSNAIHKIRKKVKKYLDQDRYEHTLGVMYTSASLAMCYGEDPSLQEVSYPHHGE